MPRKFVESSEVFVSEELSNDNPIPAEISSILRRIVRQENKNKPLREGNKQFMDTLYKYLACRAQMDVKCEEILQCDDDDAKCLLNKLNDESFSQEEEEEEEEDLFDPVTQQFNPKYQQQSLSGQPVKGLHELYEAAKQVLPIFTTKLHEMVEQESDIILQIPNLKDAGRAMEKAKEDYSDRPVGVAWVYDVVRASIVFGSAQQLISFVETLRSSLLFTIVQSKNRFSRPAFTGYRDWCLHLQVDTGLGFQFICELQLHYLPIQAVSQELGTYTFYKELRFYFAQNHHHQQQEERIQDLKTIAKGKRYHFSMLDSLIKNDNGDLDRLKRLANLFHYHLQEYEIAAKLECQVLWTAKICEMADSYETIGSILVKQGKYHEAAILHEQALQLRTETMGQRHPIVASSYFSLGLVLEKQEQYQPALTLHNKALVIRLEALGEQHPSVVASYNQIGWVYETLALYQDAIYCYQKALDLRIQIYGDKDPWVAASYSNLGGVLELQKDYPKALESHQAALEIRQQLFGNNYHHRSIPYSLNKIGGVLKELGRFDQAMEMHQQALQIQLQLLNGNEMNNPSVASTYNNLGAVYMRQQDYNQAKVMHEKALTIRLETLGDRHISVANSYSTLGVILAKQRQYDEAKSMHERALKIRLETLGEKHVSVASSYHCLGVILEKQCLLKQAEVMHRRALEIRSEVLGKDHCTVTTSSKRLQYVLDKQAEEDEHSSSSSSTSSMIRSSFTKIRSALNKNKNKKNRSKSTSTAVNNNSMTEGIQLRRASAE